MNLCICVDCGYCTLSIRGYCCLRAYNQNGYVYIFMVDFEHLYVFLYLSVLLCTRGYCCFGSESYELFIHIRIMMSRVIFAFL